MLVSSSNVSTRHFNIDKVLDALNQKQRDEVNSSIETTAEDWYKIGAKRGMLEFMRYIQEGKITVEKGKQGEITFYTDKSYVSWKMGLVISEDKDPISKNYRVSMKSLGFE